MSRLINTRDLHNVVMKRKTEYGRLATWVDDIVEKMVMETGTADAVERSKIDKAISEMENLESHVLGEIYEDGVSDCINILKRSIGE